jgi:hypothetical protein
MKKRSRQARQRDYKVIGELRPDEVLPYTGATALDEVYFGYPVKMTSLRYQTFIKNDCRCVCCGIVGTVMLLELPPWEKRPHFNLYAKREGRLVQMTKDHIQPRSKGGGDHINNMQTMCHVCNELKGDQVIKGGNTAMLERLRKIQDGVQYVYTVQRQSMHIMEGFATTARGVAEIVRNYFRVTLDFDDADDLDINVDMEKRQVIVDPNDGGYEIILHIKEIRRI